MGILWIRKDRSRLRWRLGLGTAVGLTSLAIALSLAECGGKPEQTEGSSGLRQTAQPPSDNSGLLLSQAAEARPPSASPLFDAGNAYRQARAYADCLELNERDTQGVKSELEESREVDPSGALTVQIEGAQRHQREQCRQIGPAEYRQINKLMQQAAQQNEPNARFFLLDQRVQTWIERAAIEREQGDAGQLHPDALMAVSDVEKMALQGHPPAMALAAQLFASGLLVPADPVRAAAWKVVALQRQHREPLSRDDLTDSGLVADLSPEETDQVLRDANALRSACCATRGD